MVDTSEVDLLFSLFTSSVNTYNKMVASIDTNGGVSIQEQTNLDRQMDLIADIQSDIVFAMERFTVRQ